MKKLLFLAPLVLIGFGVGFGIAAVATVPAEATELCNPNLCIYEWYCATETGPNCTNPLRPYYAYDVDGWCSDGNPSHICPDEFAGCCRFPH